MILSQEQLKDIIKLNPNKAEIAEKRKMSALLRMHVTGKDIAQFVDNIPYFEREELKRERIKMMRSNKDLISRVMRPVDKIFTAKGGMEQYTLKPEQLESEYREYLSYIAQGLPLRDWVRQIVQRNFYYNPEGLIFIEVNEDGLPYPTIKSIFEIYDYDLKGRTPEYVIFEINEAQRAIYVKDGLLPANMSKKTKVFRAVCDMYDRLVIQGGEVSAPMNIDIVTEIINPFAPSMPAIIISDMWGDEDGRFHSPLYDVVELLNAYMFAGSTFNIAYARTAYPKEWMQEFPCPTCRGERELQGEKCPECKGQGVLVSMRAADVLIVDYRGENGNQVPNPPMGRVDAPVDGLQFMRENGELLADKIDYSIWGVTKVQSQGKPSGKGGNVSGTAYEAQQNEQPRHDRLRLFSMWASGIMTFVADKCGQLLFENRYQGAAIVLGDRYMIESPDATWDRYTKAVASNAPMAILDSLLVEYIENKYNGNPIQYRKYDLLRQVEPFVHEDVQVIWADPTLPMTIKLEKKYFDEWTSTLDDYDIAIVGDNGADLLRQKLRDYVTGKYVEQKQYDTLLYTATGEMLNIGDEVEIHAGQELNPLHKGKTFSVSGVQGDNITLKDNTGKVYQGYQKGKLKRINLSQTA